jgi:hypothetical protein
MTYHFKFTHNWQKLKCMTILSAREDMCLQDPWYIADGNVNNFKYFIKQFGIISQS